MRTAEWRDRAWNRLRMLRPGEWMLAGELFDEVRPLIPMHLALRHAVRTLATGENTPLDTAQWALFTSGMRAMDCADRIPCEEFKDHGKGLGKKKTWRYQDRIRLAVVEGMECPSCHAVGSLIPLRGIEPRQKGVKRTYCERCEHPAGDERLNITPELGEAAPVSAGVGADIPPREAEPSPPAPTAVVEPVIEPRPANGKSMVPTISTEQPGKVTWLPRRAVARMIKPLLPTLSINQIDRELEATRGNVCTVLERHGFNASQQQVMVSRNRLLKTIYRAIGVPV